MNVTEKAKTHNAPPAGESHPADKGKGASAPAGVNVDDMNKRLETANKQLHKGSGAPPPNVTSVHEAAKDDATKDRITVEAHRRAMEGMVKA
jgi:hypothetical protein